MLDLKMCLNIKENKNKDHDLFLFGGKVEIEDGRPEILLLVNFGCKGKKVPSLATNHKTDAHNKPHKIYAFEKQRLGKTWSTWKIKNCIITHLWSK